MSGFTMMQHLSTIAINLCISPDVIFLEENLLYFEERIEELTRMCVKELMKQGFRQ